MSEVKEIKDGDTFEFYTELPEIEIPTESCIFTLMGDEWKFSFKIESLNCRIYIETVKSIDLKPFKIEYRVKWILGENKSVGEGIKKVLQFEKYFLWGKSLEILNKMLPSDYIKGHVIKFEFRFHFPTAPVSIIKSKTEECKTDDKIVQTPLYIDSNFLMEGVSKDLSTLFDKGPNHDVEFICGDQTIKAHKNVLGCRSEVFATMFRTEMAEGKTGQVKIQDIGGTIFAQFLRCLYTGVLPELTVDTALQIYETADKYNVLALKKQCASFLVEHLSPDNACEILIVSDRHSDPDFKKDVIEYVVQENVPFRGEKLAKFCKDNTRVAAEVLNLLCQQLPVKNKKS